MPIQILPAQLANQIAAGEVVERPASVVKELLENSLDAGATKVAIDIEKGGRQRIRIRDNGAGVAHDQLTLALSRHATSKIHSLDDLEAITTLGFRGEALASISSVARLCLTSRPANQTEAWSARAEGRDMAVQVQPAAHPVGTTVDVRDLFFNTPARRRFLRTDKTEFGHIDELVRRIALSRFDVGFTLRHNAKTIHQLAPCSSEAAREKRVASLAGEPFMRHALAVESEHGDLRLWGWIATPAGARQQPDLQYSFVNGRMMRDRLLNHAIRQAYHDHLPEGSVPAYVLYLALSPHEVDVNVHPAKHEVRFHQARLVHDFVFQALSQALAGSGLLAPSAAPSPPCYPHQVTEPPTEPALTAEAAPVAAPHRPDPGKRPLFPQRPATADHPGPVMGGRAPTAYGRPDPTQRELAGYRRLLEAGAELQAVAPAEPAEALTLSADHDLGRPLAVLRERFLLLQQEDILHLLDLARAWQLRLQHHLQAQWAGGLASHCLLLPLSLKLDRDLINAWQHHQERMQPLGFAAEVNTGRQELVFKQVPALLRQLPLQQILPRVLHQLVSWPAQPGDAEQRALCRLLASLVDPPERWTLSEARELLGELAADGTSLAESLADALAPLAVDTALSRLIPE